MGVTEFYRTRTDTKTTVAAERPAGVVVVASIGAALGTARPAAQRGHAPSAERSEAS